MSSAAAAAASGAVAGNAAAAAGEPAGVDEVWKRLQSRPGVVGLLVVADGIAVRSTFGHDASVAYAALVSQLVAKSRAVLRRLGGADDELRTLRCRSRAHEIVCCPHLERGAELCLIVVQAPSADAL